MTLREVEGDMGHRVYVACRLAHALRPPFFLWSIIADDVHVWQGLTVSVEYQGESCDVVTFIIACILRNYEYLGFGVSRNFPACRIIEFHQAAAKCGGILNVIGISSINASVVIGGIYHPNVAQAKVRAVWVMNSYFEVVVICYVLKLSVIVAVGVTV